MLLNFRIPETVMYSPNTARTLYSYTTNKSDTVQQKSHRDVLVKNRESAFTLNILALCVLSI